MSLLGLDIGTTGCKAAAFSIDGDMLASAGREYPLLHPFTGAAELDPDLLWESVKSLLAEIRAKTASDPVQALAVSSQGESCVPVDRSGRPLSNIVVTFDDRTMEQARWWEERLGKSRVFALTGMPLHAMYTINKVMWFKQHRPDVYRNTWKFLCCQDFIIHKLTGRAVLDRSLAARTMAFDVRNLRWAAGIFEQAGVDPGMLSEHVPSGTVVGDMQGQAAEGAGFPGRVTVAVGGHDQPCGALGAGVVTPDSAMNSTGSNDCLLPVMDRAVLNDEMLRSNFSCYPHVIDGLYCSIGVNLTGGLLVRWFRDNFGEEQVRRARAAGKDPYELLFADMSTEPRDVFVLPHFVGAGTPWFDPESRGAIVGLTLDVGKRELFRAIIDSINYEMKLNLEAYAEAGVLVDHIRAIGGGSKSRTWLQMKADVFGLPVYSLGVSEAVSMGGAMLAGRAVGALSSLQEAADRFVKVKERYDPDPARTAVYEEKYCKYRELYPSLERFNRTLD